MMKAAHFRATTLCGEITKKSEFEKDYRRVK
jgi:hypothetical protein